MKKTKIFLFCAGFMAVFAIITGLLCFFFANKGISDVPNFVKVERMSKDWILTTEYRSGFEYRFKLEQKMNGQFVEIEKVDSKTNTINLSEKNIDLFGTEFRFSACYTKENVAGDFSDTIEWSPEVILDKVDYSSVVFDEQKQTLSWKSVRNADSYALTFVDINGKISNFASNSPMFSTAILKAGEFKVYISAKSTNERYLDGDIGDGWSKKLKVIRKNEITAVQRDADTLYATCSQNATVFEIWVDGKLKGYLGFESCQVVQDKFVVKLSGANVFFGDDEVRNGLVYIKSCATDCILESELFQIL